MGEWVRPAPPFFFLGGGRAGDLLVPLGRPKAGILFWAPLPPPGGGLEGRGGPQAGRQWGVPRRCTPEIPSPPVFAALEPRRTLDRFPPSSRFGDFVGRALGMMPGFHDQSRAEPRFPVGTRPVPLFFHRRLHSHFPPRVAPKPSIHVTMRRNSRVKQFLGEGGGSPAVRPLVDLPPKWAQLPPALPGTFGTGLLPTPPWGSWAPTAGAPSARRSQSSPGLTAESGPSGQVDPHYPPSPQSIHQHRSAQHPPPGKVALDLDGQLASSLALAGSPKFGRSQIPRGGDRCQAFPLAEAIPADGRSENQYCSDPL